MYHLSHLIVEDRRRDALAGDRVRPLEPPRQPAGRRLDLRLVPWRRRGAGARA